MRQVNMNKKLDKFIENLTNNTPHMGQFEGIDEVEEDLVGGKPFKHLKKELNTKNKKKKENNENI